MVDAAGLNPAAPSGREGSTPSGEHDAHWRRAVDSNDSDTRSPHCLADRLGALTDLLSVAEDVGVEPCPSLDPTSFQDWLPTTRLASSKKACFFIGG